MDIFCDINSIYTYNIVNEIKVVEPYSILENFKASLNGRKDGKYIKKKKYYKNLMISKSY